MNPKSDWSAAGEVFNKAGKTDILIRHDNAVLFVAERHWWSGSKGYGKKIDQLLSDLTWRHSKTTVISFVGRKAMVPILEKIEVEARQHDCFVRLEEDHDAPWREYTFHLPGDPDCPITLSTLTFHVPRDA